MKRRILNKKIRLSILFLMPLVCCLLFFLWDGKFFFRYSTLNLYRFYKIVESGGLFDIRTGVYNPEKEIRIKRDDNLTIAGSLYGIAGERRRPGILLLHGRTSRGRNLPVYQLLAGKLAQRGYLVLTIDFAGFGESDDPFRSGKKTSFDFDADVDAALKYLGTLSNLDPDRISVIGHSQGSIATFSVGIKDRRIKTIIAIGPSRRMTERMKDPPDRDMLWKIHLHARMETCGSGFPAWYTKEVWARWRVDEDMKKYIGYFSQKRHKPLLLIDGGIESEKDRDYLQNYYQMIAEPKKYVTIQRSDHYFNTGEIGGLIFYDKIVTAQAVNEIDQWLGGAEN